MAKIWSLNYIHPVGDLSLHKFHHRSAASSIDDEDDGGGSEPPSPPAANDLSSSGTPGGHASYRSLFYDSAPTDSLTPLDSDVVKAPRLLEEDNDIEEMRRESAGEVFEGACHPTADPPIAEQHQVLEHSITQQVKMNYRFTMY